MTGVSGKLTVAAWAVLGVGSGLTMAVAAWLLISPEVGPPPAFPWQDKVFHFIAFGALTGPAMLALPKRYAPFWLAHMAALGAGIEIVQQRMGEGRTGSVTDFLADLAGIAAAYVIARLVRARLETSAPVRA